MKPNRVPLLLLLLLMLLLCLLIFTCQLAHANVIDKKNVSHVAVEKVMLPDTDTDMTNNYATNKPPTHDLPKPMQLPIIAQDSDDNNNNNSDDSNYNNNKNSSTHRNARSHRPTLMELALQESVREGLNAMTQLYSKIQPDMIRNGQLLQDDHPAALLARFNAPSEDTTQREMAAYATLSATKAFRKNYKHINELARQSHAQKISLRRTALEGLCPPRDPPTCMPAAERYRTHDGTCNNKRRPRWGASQMPFNRFLPPEYGDGVDSVRSSTDGSPLSSSRFVSLLVHGARDGEAPLTLMIAQWGQLLDHDMTSTAQPRSINGSIPSCCGGKDFHPSCFPIKVPLDDPWLSPLKVRCLEFLRSAPAQRRDCVLSWREQTNQATSYIDASPIYSNSAKASDNARVFRNGLLVYGRGNPAEDVCQRGAIATQCIRAGDGRSGEQPGLLAMHHVWVSEHNRIALELSELNLHWSDEKIYQETRRIVGAMFQHITYREFLPIVLGREVCKLFDLELLNSGYYEGYDPKVNPTVANAFAAAAFRFGHSLVQNSYMRCDRHHNVINNNVSLHEEFQRGDIGSAGSLHRLIRGLATQRALKRDEFITPELTNHLFQTPGFPFGLDLAAINIQRGRDHGVAPYTSWRVPCGLSPILNWDDFANVVGPESAKRIGHAFRSVHDIDLFVGGIAERPVVGGVVGPTFACIIAQQFSNSRKGDRFWYENGNFESSFTPAQLHSLRRVSLAQVLCRAVGGGTFQPHIFIPSEFSDNERLNCGVGPLAPIDLTPWLEQDPFAATTPHPLVFDSQVPENVFDIMTSHHNNFPINKEDKAGFSNRIKPTHQGSNSPKPLTPNIDFIPNSSIGFQRPQNLSKINDKLDIRRKTQTNNNRSTTRKPVQGVNNKLDKSPKITLNIKNVNIRRRTQTVQTTTRRTVIINNMPIELRSASAVENTKETATERTKTKTTHKKSAHETQHKVKTSDKTESRTIDNTEVTEEQTEQSKVGNENKTKTKTEQPQNNANADEPDKQKPTRTEQMTEPNNDDDIDPMKQTTNTQSEHKRVQRQLRTRSVKNDPVDKTLSTTQTNKTIAEAKLLIYKHRITYNGTTTPTTTTLTAVTKKTTKAPKLVISKTTTKRGIELRSQYHSRPIYTRPQKVVVNGPNADQYEIEINIRQTNKSPVTRPNTDYTTGYKPYGSGNYESSYAPHYLDYSSTTPSYGYYHSSPTAISTSVQPQRTRPPTIIYLTDSDEHRQTTTRSPNIFQNFLTFATSAFNNNQNNQRPTSPSPVSAPPRDRPGYETVIINSPHSSGHVVSSAPPYEPRPPTYSQVSQVSSQPHYPVSTSAQIGSNPASGYLHASSSAVSAGNFGSISGVASANGADSTFSFNIRPRPDTHQVANSYPRPIDHGGGVGSYGFLPPRKSSTYTPSYVNLPVSTPQSELYYDRELSTSQSNSPFSTGQHRPQNSNYYARTPVELKEANDVPKISADHKLDINDYDYLSRTLEQQVTHTNTTNEVESVELDDYQYDEDNDDKIAESNEDDFMAPTKKFDRDGYLRPELMLGSLGKSEMANVSKSNATYLDDNYVLPMLANKTRSYLTEMPKPIALVDEDATETYVTDVTIFPDALGKHLKNDIIAEDSVEETTDTLELSKRSVIGKMGIRQAPAASNIAFAPIKVLTQPERPDNWVIFDTPSEKPLLPQTPTIKMDTQPSEEVPMPIKDFNGLWQKEQLKKNHSKVKELNETKETKSELTTVKEAIADETTTMRTSQDDIKTTLMPN